MIKQVIVMRTDLNMRKGKMIAQGAHASIAFLTEGHVSMVIEDDHPSYPPIRRNVLEVNLTDEATAWIEGKFTKVCVRVDSEEELHRIVKEAKDLHLTVSLIQDAGLTEFGGVPTYTCAAIGPNTAEDIDKVTGELRLL